MQKSIKRNKPRHEVFFELLEETRQALTEIRIIRMERSGIKPLTDQLKRKKIKLAHGSIRLDRDNYGTVFMQEYRPGTGIFHRGEFYSICSDRPIWEILGTAIIRLARRCNRSQELSREEGGSKREYCLVLQGKLDIDFVIKTLGEGRFSYNTYQKHLQEKPIYSALAVLSRLIRKQVVEIHLKDKSNPEDELNAALFTLGKSVKNIACVIGKNKKGVYYTAPYHNKTSFPPNICDIKVVPIEIAKEICRCHKFLLQNNGLLVLDDLTFEKLTSCLTDREKYYFQIAPN